MSTQPTAGHTPGPWQIQWLDDSGECGDAYVLALTEDSAYSILEGGFVLEDDAENRANARLIAAAPDLLAACEAFLKWEADNLAGDWTLESWNAALGAARAALRTAREG